MRKDHRSRRAQQDAEARNFADRQKTLRATMQRQYRNVYKHDMADPVGYSPTWETSSPNRHASITDATGWNPNKTPGTGD